MRRLKRRASLYVARVEQGSMSARSVLAECVIVLTPLPPFFLSLLSLLCLWDSLLSNDYLIQSRSSDSGVGPGTLIPPVPAPTPTPTAAPSPRELPFGGSTLYRSGKSIRPLFHTVLSISCVDSRDFGHCSRVSPPCFKVLYSLQFYIHTCRPHPVFLLPSRQQTIGW